MQNIDSEPPRNYVSPGRYSLEIEHLFSRAWVFAGLTGEVAKPDDFLRVPVAGSDVIVHNAGGTLRAFINACSHRHSLIHTEARGHRPLVCPYHGWAYDRNGAPTRIPAPKDFPQVTANPGAWSLKSVELDQAGQFLFVRITPGGPGLAEFLGETGAFLENVSGSLDRPLDEFRSTIHANWKLVIENSLEGYHVPMVHRSTLGANQQFSREAVDIIDHLVPSGHSFMTNGANARWLKRWQTHAAETGSWPFSFNHYVHRLVFPMLTVTSFLGYSFHIQRFHPDAHDATGVHSRIYASAFSGQTERGRRTMEAIFRENIDFTRRIFEEDRRACETTHAGVLQSSSPAVFGSTLEQRVADFRRTYLKALGSAG